MASDIPHYDPATYHFDVMLSSTFKDLIECRKRAAEAVRGCTMVAINMEDEPARPEDILTNSLDMVSRAHVYIGIIGSRYGQILEDPRNQRRLSVTEMEYEKALEQGKPIHIFVIQEDSDRSHLNRMLETDEQQQKLTQFLQRLSTQHVLKETTIEELKYEIGRVLAEFRQGKVKEIKEELRESLVAHRPEKRITPYGTHTSSSPGFVGRKDDLALLDNWAASPTHSVAVIQALGGMGKSTLTWEWIDNKKYCQTVMKPAGIVWWNFYDPNATVKEFVRHVLAFITNRDLDSFDKADYQDHAESLFKLLRDQNYLLVLDGLERILVEYRHWYYANMKDDEIPADKRRRDCIDPFDGYVLEKLTDCMPSRVLVSTRLLPGSFERHNSLLRSVWRHELNGLLPEDADVLSHSLGVKKRDLAKFHQFFAGFSYHPLIITIVAPLVSEYSFAPGDFDMWLSREGENLKFADLDVKQRKTMIFEFAMRGLTDTQKEILAQVAAFSGPVLGENLFRLNPYLPPNPPRPTLPRIPQVYPNPLDLNQDEVEVTKMINNEKQLLSLRNKVIAERRTILEKWRKSPEVSPPKAEKDFGADLSLLVNRGLLQRNNTDQTYDLHPLLRRFINDSLDPSLRARVTANVRRVFGSLAPSATFRARSVKELESYFIHYETAISLGNYDEAATLFINDLREPLYRLGEFPRIITLLQKLYTDNDDPELLGTVRLDSKLDADFIRHEMARSLDITGEIEKAQNQQSDNFLPDIDLDKPDFLIVSLMHYATLQSSQGRFAEWHQVLHLAQQLTHATRDRIRSNWLYLELGRYYAVNGDFDQAQDALQRVSIRNAGPTDVDKDLLIERLALRRLVLGIWKNQDVTRERAQIAELHSKSYVTNIVILYWLAYDDLQKHDLRNALEKIEQSVRLLNQSSMPAGRALALRAEILLAATRTEEAHHSLNEALQDINRDRLEMSDLYLSVARFYITLGNLSEAESYARQAFDLTCVQGMPYYYWWGVEQAKLILQKLNVAVPDIPVFNARTEEQVPMPHEFQVREYIESKKPEDTADPFIFGPPDESESEPESDKVTEFRGIRWVRIGVIAHFAVTDADTGAMLTDISHKLYSLCDNPGPVDPTTSDQLVDPNSTRSGVPLDQGIEQAVFEEVREELNPITVAAVGRKHDGISVLFIHAFKGSGEPVWLYMSIRVEKLMRFFEQVRNGETIKVADFGRVVHQMNTPPTQEDIDMMFDNWLCVNRYLAVKLIARKAGGD